MSTSSYSLFLSEESEVPSPSVAEIPAIMKHLNSHPEAYFLLQYDGGNLQGYETEDSESTAYHLEYSEFDEETFDNNHWRNCEPVSMENLAHIITLVIEKNNDWRQHIRWEQVDLSMPSEGEVNIGSFPPKEAQDLLTAFELNDIPVRMEQNAGTSFALIIPATDISRANEVVAKSMNVKI
ncbi:hypothetical protein P3T73_05715 [Kiritimatiellota bacterium B12222]|nr:hypothetical protein P3T73_05715 [Kiritimatiellota bacterium B12222]